MLSNDVFTQLAIGYARQAGMENTQNSLDGIFKQGRVVGAKEQAVLSAHQGLKDATGRWGVTSSLDGILKTFTTEQETREYLNGVVSPTKLAAGLLGAAGSAKKSAAGKLSQARAWMTRQKWDGIVSENGGNTVEVGKLRGVRFEAQKDPSVAYTLFRSDK